MSNETPVRTVSKLVSTLVAAALSGALVGCHQLYPEDVTALHASDQLMLSAYQDMDPLIASAKLRAAFCADESVLRRHKAGVLVTPTIVCEMDRK